MEELMFINVMKHRPFSVERSRNMEKGKKDEVYERDGKMLGDGMKSFLFYLGVEEG